jgi:hypothetical protein
MLWLGFTHSVSFEDPGIPSETRKSAPGNIDELFSKEPIGNDMFELKLRTAGLVFSPRISVDISTIP